MGERLLGSRAQVLTTEIEGILKDFQLLPVQAGRNRQALITVEGGASMVIAAPRFIDVLDEETGEERRVPVENGVYGYPIDLMIGEPFAVRSVIVPSFDEDTGIYTERQKRYLFPQPGKPIALASILTEEEYLASDYKNKPKAAVAGQSAEVEAF